MPEPTTILGASAVTAYLAKDGVQKLLGPTADYLGQNLQQFVERRHNNVQSIIESAIAKLGSNIDDPGSVPPRVLRAIVEEGSYADDSLTQQYFGGVLASSRSPVGRDDRGLTIAKTLERMSAYQIRAHYIIYSSFFDLFAGREINVNQTKELVDLRMFFSTERFLKAMEFSNSELGKFGEILPHILFGLESNRLLASNFNFGKAEHLESHVSNIEGAVGLPGLVCSPTKSGLELFCWGHGLGNVDTKRILEAKEYRNFVDSQLLKTLNPLASKPID